MPANTVSNPQFFSRYMRLNSGKSLEYFTQSKHPPASVKSSNKPIQNINDSEEEDNFSYLKAIYLKKKNDIGY